MTFLVGLLCLVGVGVDDKPEDQEYMYVDTI